MRARVWMGALAALLLCSVPASKAAAQDGQDNPYFSLSSSATFYKETPSIQVSTHRVGSLEFRMYRVNDPVAFFQNLEDPHQFGGQAPRLRRETTLIEKFHRWKLGLRSSLRNIVRRQYSPDSRAEIRDRRLAREQAPPKPATTGKGTETYPAIPLLNAQQVVAVWSERFSTARPWEYRSVTLPVSTGGLYLVEATNGDLRAYTIVSITGVAVITKTAPGRILNFVVDRGTGAPIQDGQVDIIADGKTLTAMKTDASGVSDTRMETTSAPENILVLVRRGDDFAANAVYGGSLETNTDRSLWGYVYTDRPVYRPGHTVYFKSILRSDTPSGYQLITRKQVDVEITDPEGNPIYRKTLPVSATGTVNDEFVLPASALLGYYAVTIRAGDGSANGNFQVEEYKKPEYEVKVTPEKPRVLQGEPVTVRIEARYYFGEPVAFGKVKVVTHASRYWFYPRGEDYDDEFDGEEYGDYAGEEISEQSVQLDADGKAMVTIPTPVSRDKYDMRYRVEARVTDESNREVAGHGTIIATYGSFVVRIRAEDYVVQTGTAARMLIQATDYDSRPIETAARIELRPARSGPKRPDPIYVGEARTGADGKAEASVPISSGGSFEVTVVAQTPEGREVSSNAYVWATGAGAADRFSRPGEMIELVPDKKSYKPGDVARILITAAAPDAHVLVTVEGRAIASYEVARLDDGTLTVSVPIKAESVPNVYVNAVFLKDGKQYEGSKELRVPPTERELTVEIEPSKKQFKPGEPAVFAVSTKDSEGRPVSAEVSVGIVDEALYAVKPDSTRDIVKFFYGTSYNHINTYSSLRYYFTGASGKKQMRLTEIRPPTALGQLKPERLVEPRIRKAFPDTAFWAAAIRTDANGRGEARMEFPDALTTWRVTARAVTADTRVGSVVDRTIVRKNLVVRLAVPRFFTEGDRVIVSALVHNYLESEKKTTVSLTVEGLEVIEGATKEVTIPSRADIRVDWTVRAGADTMARLTAKALTNEESDAMELTLPVVPYGVKLDHAQSGSLAGTNSAVAPITFPPKASPASRNLEIRIAPSIGGAVFGALGYLSTYPYGCVEQTMSSFLPNVIVTRALKDLNIRSGIDEAALTKKTREGLQRLYDFQHEDGGWGWWQTDDSGAFMTAYVVAGMAQAKAAGINIRDGSLERGVAWLGKEFDQSDRVIPEMRAYLLYALTLGGVTDRAKIDSVWAQRGRMETYGLAFLGLALDRAGDSTRAGEIAATLEGRAMSNDREAWWPSDRDWMLDFYGDTTPETTAHVLKLLVKLRPKSPLLPKAALWLAANRSAGYYWSSTKQTAMVVYGLVDYLKASGELEANSHVRVLVDGREVLAKTFTPEDALSIDVPSVRVNAPDLAAAAHEVRIEKDGGGTVYWDVRANYVSTEEKLTRTGTVALNLLRDYYVLVPETVRDRIVHRLTEISGPLHPGDVIAVRLTISGGAWRYLMAEDPIPAGTEFIAREDLYELSERPPWWQTYYTRREFHDDRATFFQTRFQGQTQYFYLLKVVNPGEFRANPARVEPMYQPEFLSATESRALAVNP
ncbi:MAG TPA: MG2 domain-containing protein [Terriglobia bacterium]|nr:MG2 domain-containing protein [Terriglobia bacterium]